MELLQAGAELGQHPQVVGRALRPAPAIVAAQLQVDHAAEDRVR